MKTTHSLRSFPLLVLAAAPLVLAHPSATAAAEAPESAESPAERQVQSLLEHFRSGKPSRPPVALDSLGKVHLPYLLEAAEDTTPAERVPTNPLSSQSQSACSTGMIALWLVEGIRVGGIKGFTFPSLNPLCFRKGDTRSGIEWSEASRRNHPDVAAAYAKWWQRFTDSGAASDFEHPPLEGTGLAWF